MNLMTEPVVNVASVPHRSPFRYPGGKTWLVPLARRWLASLARPRCLYEPFAGGAIVGLSAIFEELADHLVIVELDADVASVWRVILSGQGQLLKNRILSFRVTQREVRRVLDAEPETILDRAFATIIRNRMQRGGIMAAGASLMKSGENGKGLLSRWYPNTLGSRIDGLTAIRRKICFMEDDGIQVMRQNAHRSDAAFFVDPPYTVAGRRLYAHSEINHDELFRVASRLEGDFLMTYDNADAIRQKAHRHGFDTAIVPMKNTHHTVMGELLIGKNLAWLKSDPGCHSRLTDAAILVD